MRSRQCCMRRRWRGRPKVEGKAGERPAVEDPIGMRPKRAHPYRRERLRPETRSRWRWASTSRTLEDFFACAKIILIWPSRSRMAISRYEQPTTNLQNRTLPRESRKMVRQGNTSFPSSRLGQRCDVGNRGKLNWQHGWKLFQNYAKAMMLLACSAITRQNAHSFSSSAHMRSEQSGRFLGP